MRLAGLTPKLACVKNRAACDWVKPVGGDGGGGAAGGGGGDGGGGKGEGGGGGGGKSGGGGNGGGDMTGGDTIGEAEPPPPPPPQAANTVEAVKPASTPNRDARAFRMISLAETSFSACFSSS